MVEGKKSINLLRGLLYLSPAIILMAIFTFYPIINTFIIAFQEEYNMLALNNPKATLYTGIGLGNFEYLFVTRSKDFFQSLINTVVIVFVSVPLSIVLSLLIAVALNSVKSLQKFFQTVFFLPYVTNTIAIGMVFAVIFNSHDGLMNYVVRLLGGENINWLGYNHLAPALGQSFLDPNAFLFTPQWLSGMVVLLVYIVWNSLPFKVIILLSALQSIDKQYYQAAQIDGTSKFRIFSKITVPLLSPQIFYLLITSFIGAFKEYTSVVAIFDKTMTTGGGSNMKTIVGFIRTYTITDPGYAAAGAIVLFVIIMIFTAINGWVGKKRVHF